MNKIDNIISFIARHLIIILFSIIIIGMLIVNSVYLYIDTPSFRLNNIWNYLGILFSTIILGLMVLFHKLFLKKFPNFKFLNVIIIVIYIIAEIIYLKLVPMNPFSDSAEITKIALSDFKENIRYLQSCNNNLPITIILNLIFRITVYSIMSFKIFNIVCFIVTLYYMYKICSLENKNTSIIIFGTLHLSTFLYTNQIYNDTICIMIITCGNK